jgi:protein TonB
MVIRYLKAAPLGIAVTLSLLYAMQSLIERSAGPALTAIKRFEGVFVRTETPEILIPIQVKPEPIDPPPLLPSAPQQEPFSGEAIRTSTGIPIPPPVESATTIHGFDNQVFVNTLKVSPTYPIAAARKGLEGWVIVRFDVSALGLVENISIVESSSTLFNKAAKNAVARFRYQPRVVDGVGQPVFGLMNKFVFEMDD